MRIPVMEGFDYYAALTGQQGAMNTVWNFMNQQPTSLITGLGGDGKAIFMQAGANHGTIALAFGDGDSQVTCHFAIEVTSRNVGSDQCFLEFRTALNSRQFGLGMNVAGELQLVGEGNAVVATGTVPLVVNQVYRCCLRADIAAGTFDISINGDDDPGLHVTGVDINDDSTSTLAEMVVLQVVAGGGASALSYNFDDLIVGLGGLVDWGPQEINTLPASADVAVTWTPLVAGNNYSQVDNIPFDVDTTYNSSATVGQQDIFDFNDPPHNPESILAVAIVNVARKEESAVRKFADIIRVGAVDYLGTEHNLAETYGQWFTVWQQNPASASPWVPSDITGLRGGYRLTVVS